MQILCKIFIGFDELKKYNILVSMFSMNKLVHYLTHSTHVNAWLFHLSVNNKADTL